MNRRANGEGTFGFDPKRNQFYGVITLPDGRRKWFRDQDEKRVRSLVRGALVDMEHGLPVASNKQTLAQYLHAWHAGAVQDHERRSSTLRGYASNIEHIIPIIGRVRLGEVQPTHVQLLRRGLRAKGLAEKTVTYIVAVLRVALGDAVELEVIARNPAQVAARRGRKRGAQTGSPFQAQFLDLDAAHRLLAAASDERLEALFGVAVALGLRRGEILGLRWCDVDFDQREVRIVHQLQREPGQGLVFVPVKSDQSARVVALPALLVTQLRAHKERQGFERRTARNRWQDHDLVFCSVFGTGIETTTLFRVWSRVRDRAGIDARFHDLRHSAASLLLAQGVPLWEVSKILGHASQQFTADVYGHLSAESRRHAADVMNAILTGNS